MQKQHFTVALLITLVLSVTVTVWGLATSTTKSELNDLNNQLQHAQGELTVGQSSRYFAQR